MTDASAPSNPLIKVLGDADRRQVGFPGLFDDPKPYVLQLECEEDFKDIDSILWGLAYDRSLLVRFPELNTWETNPLFGIDQEHVHMLGQAHVFRNPRWLREEVDVRMLLSSVGEPGGSMGPLVVLGLPNFASHLALLGCLVGASWHGAVVVHPDESVEVEFSAKRKDGTFDKCFISRIDMARRSSDRQLEQLRHAARRGEPVPIMLPITPANFDEMLSPKRLPVLHVPLTSVGYIVLAAAIERTGGESSTDDRSRGQPSPVAGRIGTLSRAA